MQQANDEGISSYENANARKKEEWREKEKEEGSCMLR
jgi:hypothetical protein